MENERTIRPGMIEQIQAFLNANWLGEEAAMPYEMAAESLDFSIAAPPEETAEPFLRPTGAMAKAAQEPEAAREPEAAKKQVRLGRRAESAKRRLSIMGLHLAEEEAPDAEMAPAAMHPAPIMEAEPGFSPDESRFQPGESFAAAVLRMIDERGMTDPQCYARANLSRAVFNKLKQSALNPSEREYRPSKETALALTMGLGLSLDEARELLEKAGFALSHSSKRDLIVEYFLMAGNHDIFELNVVLDRFQQEPLGSF